MDSEDCGRWLAQLAKNPDFGLFAYEPMPRPRLVDLPQGLAEHLVYLVVSGLCEGVAAEEPIRLVPGSLMWLKPRTPFALQASDPDQRTSLYRFRLRPLPGEPGGNEPVVVVPDAWELSSTFDMLIAELGANRPYRDQRVPALLQVLFTGIFRLADDRKAGGRALEPGQRRLLESYVDQHINRRVTPEELAEQVGLSPDYFTRRFRQTFEVPPRVWLVRRRIRQAALRLDEGPDSITEVATDFGYSDVFLFSRQFKAVMGVSPRAYRSR
ncbi:AraC family transcriptional regulator [Streptomyces sp. NPDC004752]